MTPSSATSRPHSTQAGHSPTSPLLVGAIAAVGALPIVGELYVVLPLAREIRGLPGGSDSTVALASTLFALAYALGILVLGPLTDRYGARAVMITSSVATALATVATACAPSASWFLAGRVIQGVAAAAFTPAVLAYIARTCLPSQRVPLNTAAIGAGLASAVVSQIAAQVVSPIGGLRGVFLVFALATLAVTVVIIRFLPVDRNVSAHRPALGAIYRSMIGLLSRTRLVLLYCTGATFLSVLVAAYAALAADSHWSSGQLLAVRASSLPAVIVAGILTVRLMHLPARTRILSAIGVAVAGMLLCATAQPVAIALGLFAVVGAITLAAPSVVAEVTRWGAPAVGAAASLYTVSIFGGASLGAPISALVGQGLTTVCLVGAVILSVGGATAAWATRR